MTGQILYHQIVISLSRDWVSLALHWYVWLSFSVASVAFPHYISLMVFVSFSFHLSDAKTHCNWTTSAAVYYHSLQTKLKRKEEINGWRTPLGGKEVLVLTSVVSLALVVFRKNDKTGSKHTLKHTMISFFFLICQLYNECIYIYICIYMCVCVCVCVCVCQYKTWQKIILLSLAKKTTFLLLPFIMLPIVDSVYSNFLKDGRLLKRHPSFFYLLY